MSFIIEIPNGMENEPHFDYDPFYNGRFFTSQDEMMSVINHAYDVTKKFPFPVLFRYISGNQVFRIPEFNKHSKRETLNRISKIVSLYGLYEPDQYPVIVNLTDDEKEEAKRQNIGNPQCRPTSLLKFMMLFFS